MKNIKVNVLVLSALTLMAIGMNSCKEVGPQLPWGNTSVLSDTTYVESPVQAPETKNVLIEELTGVSCVNCPQGHTIVKQIEDANAGRVIGISMHGVDEPAAQDEPIPHLTTQEIGCLDVRSLITSFGEPGQRPAGAIDRMPHNDISNNSVWTDRGNWGSAATLQLSATTPVNVILSSTYDSVAKKIAVSVEMHYTAAQPDSSQALTIYLTEDSIVTAQLNGSAIDTFYVQNAVLRKAITTATGDKMNVAIKPGTVVRRLYSYQITNALWKPEHMNIVAFVHKSGGSAYDVLQVKTKKVK